MAGTIDKNASNATRYKSSRLSLKAARKQLSEISPAPVPRTSHRLRTQNSDTDKVSTDRQTDTDKVTGSKRHQSYNSENKEDDPNNIFNGLTVTGRAHGISPLANLGNTCFLNSVLYALRFLPGFMHDLHHLYSQLQNSDREMTLSLSQRVNFLSELHNVFALLNKNEDNNIQDGKKIPALHPLQFLESVRSINPQFEGNRQQDAHELLHCLLDQLCNLPQDLLNIEPIIKDAKSPKSKRRKKISSKTAKEISASKSLDMVGSKFMGEMTLETRCCECETMNGRDETFLEVCVPVRTKSDLDDDEDVSDTEVLLTALCTEESLLGSNKYWCDFCCHHNEAGRSVHFRRLPQNLLIHVKRFSSYTRTFASKCCEAMPAPLQLPCFCHQCQRVKDSSSSTLPNGVGEKSSSPRANRASNPSRQAQQSSKAEADCRLNASPQSDSVDADSCGATSHLPYFLAAFVCHLGATISSGHYVSFVHVSSRSRSSCLTSSLAKNGSPFDSSQSEPNGNAEQPCSFFECCSSHLDRLVSSTTNIINGTSQVPFSSRAGRDNSGGVWLECDDEKIRVVSSTEVAAVMKSDMLTPYLLFYSR